MFMTWATPLFVSVAMPFREVADDYFAKACAFALTALFFFSLVLKVGTLTESMDEVMSSQLRSRFSFNAGFVTIGMVASILGALVLAGGLPFPPASEIFVNYEPHLVALALPKSFNFGQKVRSRRFAVGLQSRIFWPPPPPFRRFLLCHLCTFLLCYVFH